MAVSANTVCFGDIIYLQQKGLTLFYSPNCENPILVSEMDKYENAFRNGLWQIFPASFSPLEKSADILCREKIPVKQNSQIIFFHIESKRFLSAESLVKSREDSSALSDFKTLQSIEDTTFFNIVNLSDNDENDEVVYNKGFLLRSDKFDLDLGSNYMEANFNGAINTDSSVTNKTTYFPKVMPRRNPLSKVGNVLNPILKNSQGQAEENAIVMTRYQSAESLIQQKDTVFTGDYVRIRYGDQYLSFYNHQDNKTQPYFEKIEDPQQPHNYIHSIFQVVKETGEIEPLNTKNKYVLKHFNTGHYLHYKSPSQLKVFSQMAGSVEGTDENVFAQFETERGQDLITDKQPIRIKYRDYPQNHDFYIIPSEGVPLQNVQYETNTLYFFGFKIPEEYSFKNLKSVRRNLAETNTQFQEEGFNATFEKVDSQEMQEILRVEAYANELQKFLDFLSSSTTGRAKKMNDLLNSLVDLSIEFLDKLQLIDKIDTSSPDLRKISYRIKIPNRKIQDMVREFRIFDLIHMINFYMIKLECKAVIDTKSGKVDEEFNIGNFIHLYDLFVKILISALTDNIPNRFYNSQFIRVYIHFMGVKLDGVLSPPHFAEMKHTMRGNTLSLLKILLWDEDLDGLGQLNFYQDMIFDAFKQCNGYYTYYLDLIQHISSSKAYNLTNSFRDAFVSRFLTLTNGEPNEQFTRSFPTITNSDGEIVVSMGKSQMSFLELLDNDQAYKYFISSVMLLISLSTSKLMTYYHAIIKMYPLHLIQKVIQDSSVDITIRMLFHLIMLNGHLNYVKLPVTQIPPTIQTSSEELRKSLAESEEDIKQSCNTIFGSLEKEKLEGSQILELVQESVGGLNTQDSSIQISLLNTYIKNECDRTNCAVALFYLDSILNKPNLNIHLLNKSKETLVKMRNRCMADEYNLFDLLPDILFTFTQVNNRMKVHSTNAIYNQVIKTKIPNAETYSKKIMAGLKKIHFESFTCFDLLALNEPHISNPAIQYLEQASRYEESMAQEMQKFVILSSQEDIENVKKVISITLSLNQVVRDFMIQKELNKNQIKCSGETFMTMVEQLQALWKIIYHIPEHFDVEELQGQETDPIETFFKRLKVEKLTFRDLPFKINPNAINRLYQSIFAVLQVHEVLLNLINCTIFLTITEKVENQPEDNYLPRLAIMNLIAFTHKNRSNQDTLVNNHSFVTLHYQQKYIDKSCDSLILFAEVMRDNEPLLEVSKKFIYDITSYTFLGTIKPREINDSSGSYLTSSLMSMHFLYKANIPKANYDTFTVAETKFDQLSKNTFNKIDVIHNLGMADGNMKATASYNNISEFLLEFSDILKKAIRDGKNDAINKIRNSLSVQKFLSLLQKSSFELQFDLKNKFLRLLRRGNFSRKSLNNKFMESKQDSVDMIAYLFNEILQYFIFTKQSSEEIEGLKEVLTGASEIVGSHIKQYAERMSDTKMEILPSYKITLHLQQLTLSQLWSYYYIFQECWLLLTKLISLYPNIVTEMSFMAPYIDLSNKLIGIVDTKNFKIISKIKSYLGKIKTMEPYAQFASKLSQLEESLGQVYNQKSDELNQKLNKNEEEFKEIGEQKCLRNIIQSVATNKKQDQEENMRGFCEAIKNNKDKLTIFSELINTLHKNPTNLRKEYSKFVATLLEKYFGSALPEAESLGMIQDPLLSYFYETQEEIVQAEGETKLANSVKVMQNFTNLQAIFELLLTYTEGFNPKVLEKVSETLQSTGRSMMSSLRDYEIADEMILSMVRNLSETPNKELLDENTTRAFEYVIKSLKTCKENPKKAEQIHQLTPQQQRNTFNTALVNCFNKYANKSVEDIIKDDGPLPVTIHTFGQFFKTNSNDISDNTVKKIKNQFVSIVRNSNLVETLKAKFNEFRSTYRDDLTKAKLAVTFALELYISKIKFNIVSSED